MSEHPKTPTLLGRIFGFLSAYGGVVLMFYIGAGIVSAIGGPLFLLIIFLAFAFWYSMRKKFQKEKNKG